MDARPTDEEAGTAQTTARVQQQRGSIPSFLFISFILFMLTNHNGDEFLARHQYQEALASLAHQRANFTAWMNGSASDFVLAPAEPGVGPLVHSLVNLTGAVDTTEASYYPNVTGFIHGDSKFYNISPPHLTNATSPPTWANIAQGYMADANASAIAERANSWNWTASEKIALSVVEKPPVRPNSDPDQTEDVVLVHGRIELTDINTSEDLRLEFEGVHFISNGSIYGFAEPIGRHVDIRQLPSLVPESYSNVTAQIIEPELSARITKLKNLIDDGVVDQEVSNNDEPPKSTCPFTFYAQLHPTMIPGVLMQDLEDELQKPTGASTVKPPKLSLDGILISKECGLLYEITNTEGLRSLTFFRKVTTYAAMAAAVYLALLVLLSRQMGLSRTPTGISRVSRWTFLTQSVVDAVSFAGHITFAILAEGRPSLSLIAPAFLGCLLFVYGAQFAMLINQIQIPEDTAPPPRPMTPVVNQAADPSGAPTTQTPPATGSLPTPVVQPMPSPASPSFLTLLVRHLRTDPQARLWLSVFLFLTFIVRVVLSPTLGLLFVSITYSFFWLPQIVRSARRGRSSGLKAEYIFGTTFCRLYFALYFLACPRNVLDVEPRRWVYVLALFVILQAIVVVLQENFGPTFFLPKRFATVRIYDYHPPMPLPDAEAPEQSLGDCAICLDAIHVDPSLRQHSKSFDEKGERKSQGRAGSHAGGGILNAVHMGVSGSARKNYSLAPCHHLFHTDCLEKWLAIKNICPQCRRPLPPL